MRSAAKWRNTPERVMKATDGIRTRVYLRHVPISMRNTQIHDVNRFCVLRSQIKWWLSSLCAFFPTQFKSEFAFVSYFFSSESGDLKVNRAAEEDI